MKNQLPGGFSQFNCKIDEEAKASFADAFEHIVGVDYQPIAVATQVVAGLNYAFFCNATVVYPGAVSYPAIVHIFRSLDGKSAITNIQRVAY
ncbi:hypothetical protein CJF42_00290 [Pseudoalteromonas sp. NBT06-2]|uniref:hypothetical protein n=1 Tax=Pseudoalteromonas sp. NBT06-2 TaxID=2025950 RepID=UPI000BA607DD|nr:hypothetical protein [Pseudoalteromonas sp. NBT06-2]PAJ76375.1 hypothetical protein CJF42_00290 [Pseudoalteromonas sp. NBT06-2]